MNRVVNIDYEFVDVLSTYTFDMKNYSNKVTKIFQKYLRLSLHVVSR